MSDFKFSVNEEEYKRVIKKLSELADVDKKQLLKTSFKEGGQILVAAGKASLKQKNKNKTGNLYRSFTTHLKKKNSGILVGFKRGKGLGNHAHLIDRGTTDRYTKEPYTDKLGRNYPAGLYRGKIDDTSNGKTGKTYFWTDVVDAKGQKALDKVMDAIYTAIEEIKNRN